MQISLRSQLIAGTAAVVGASAIAMTPVTGAPLSLSSIQAPSAVQTALVAFSSPLAALSETVIQSSAYLFNTDLDPAEADSWFYANSATSSPRPVRVLFRSSWLLQCCRTRRRRP